jgi:hypothetical protein
MHTQDYTMRETPVPWSWPAQYSSGICRLGWFVAIHYTIRIASFLDRFQIAF